MTSKEQIMSPVVATRQSDGFVRPKIATEEALKVLNLQPSPTVWKYVDGRPIYNRLPAISQQYQKGYDRDQAYVYLKPKFGKTTGPGSLQAGTQGKTMSVLFVQDGTITWREGQVNVPAYQVDISELDFGLGLADGDYQVGYLLSYGIPEDTSLVPGYAKVEVEASLLSEAAISTEASGGSEDHEAFRAVSFDGSWWPGGTTEVETTATYELDFQVVVEPNAFILKSDDTEPATSEVTLSWSDDGSTWTDVVTAAPIEGLWNLPVVRNLSKRYWRFTFAQGSASIEEILYTGTAYFPDNRVSTPQQIATPYIDNVFEDFEGDYILLAFFNVKNGKIQTVTDYRVFSTVLYEPVADWLTKPQDDSLTCLFDDVENYSTKFLAPPTADYHFYDELSLTNCLSYDEFTVEEK